MPVPAEGLRLHFMPQLSVNSYSHRVFTHVTLLYVPSSKRSLPYVSGPRTNANEWETTLKLKQPSLQDTFTV